MSKKLDGNSDMSMPFEMKRMDNVGIAVESLDEVIIFFTELGLKLEGRAMVEGEWAGSRDGMKVGSSLLTPN